MFKANKINGYDLLLKERKIQIQNAFREKLGLIVDVPKPGFGTSNDGNTARRFFKHSDVSADTTGIDHRLIERFSIVLQTLSCGYHLNFEKFGNYCYETAQLYIYLYDWYYMPPSVHKIVLHGASIVKSFILPIGQMSEETKKGRNKVIKKYRENHSEKSSRVNINTDIFQRLLLSSNPIISSLSDNNNKKKRTLHPFVKTLLREVESECDQQL